MKLPFIRRSTHEADLRAAVEAEWRHTRKAESRAHRAELALQTAFNLTVEDVFGRDGEVLTVRLTVHKSVLTQYKGGREAMAEDVARRLVYDLYSFTTQAVI